MICDQSTRVSYYHAIATHCRRLRQLYGLSRAMGGYGLGGLGGRNCATVWFNVAGNVRHVTCSSEATPGLGYSKHSEKACFDDIQRELAEGAEVVQVYTERFPCGPQNQNCFNFLQQRLDPDVRVYWSFDWPDASFFTGKRKREDPDEYGRAAKKAKHLRAEGTKQCKLAGRAVLQRGPWGTAYA